jgi:hypothetical protein
VRSPRSEYGRNVVPFCPTQRCTVGLTIEETIEFEALDALPPFDDSGNMAWVFEGEPTTRREKRWLELYLKRILRPPDAPARAPIGPSLKRAKIRLT